MLVMSDRVLPVLLLSLSLTVGSVQSQGSSQDAFIIQYLERRLAQIEERLNQCEQNTVSITQKTYDLSSEIRGYLSTLSVVRSEVKSQVDTVSVRVDRVERELEYLENKIPTQSEIEMEEALLEQQIKAAELDQLKKKAKIKVEKDCSTALSQIKSLKIVKKAGDTYGSWFKDPSAGSAKVYLLSGIRNDTVLEYDSLQSFTERTATPPAKVVQLPFHWQGTGHVVFNGFLYCHKADTPNQILKVDLLNGTVVDSTLLPGAGRLPVYSLNPNTYLDLAVDELGLWVIHADAEYGGNLVITKLDKGTLAVDYTWDTQCRSRDAEGAFLICGTLYVVYNTRYGGRSTIQCLYDIHDTIHSDESPVMFFPKRYTSHSSIHYHPEDKQLYAWDDGYQTIYTVETRRNDQVTTE
ncbi:olfactomedin-like protein 3A [Micropterus salmoides]|uniref:olfactomedin-like protein 3A n=1 Tax=Micropterus salmoides TaxID=27706 RepID=UPI0018ED624B|nr:olfactomedin-like protein 3A [Micropterus salmoides]XP_038562706.1 olfactomedin-like protein 3A [Micropterus salmoides]XP_045892540.1 olfactomedin-like protein 3A [Micropterus dolomieu]